MALSLETTIIQAAVATADGGIPSGYTLPATTHTFTAASKDETESITIAVSGVSDAANAVTGITALVSAVDTYISGTYVPELGLDTTTYTVNMIATIRKVTRAITTSSIFVTGTDNYTCVVNIEWEIA